METIVKIGIVIAAAFLSGILYRIGGKGGFAHAKAIRRFGCPFVIYGYLWLIRGNLGLKGAILTVFAYILTTFSLSTYHDYLAPDKTRENWLCWLMTGFVYGLAAFPFIWIGIHWYSVIIRAVVLAITIMWLRERTSKVFIEEFFSGAIFCLTIPILLI